MITEIKLTPRRMTLLSDMGIKDLNDLINYYPKKYDDLNAKLGTSPNPNVKTKFNDGKIKLSEAGQKVSSIQADIDRGKTGKDVDDKISQTRELLKEANDIYNEISGTS